MGLVLTAPRTIATAATLAVIVGITLASTAVAEHRGMCGPGDFPPSCAMFAVGLNIFGMIAVSAVTTLATLVTYALRRRPPVLPEDGIHIECRCGRRFCGARVGCWK